MRGHQTRLLIKQSPKSPLSNVRPDPRAARTRRAVLPQRPDHAPIDVTAIGDPTPPGHDTAVEASPRVTAETLQDGTVVVHATGDIDLTTVTRLDQA
ncbi:hypothetical protein, partial [Amycolatopsis minnesotensis]|uniref:hypothetical protein n=1 Tax=Amycolatopsis minnesotensis TaxID=337894 RepID=UPI0031D5F139